MSVKVDGTNGLLQNYDYQAPTTGFSYTFTSANVLVMNPAGTLATGTITMPASPVDGMTVSFSSTQAVTALTVNANTGQSIVGAVSSLKANSQQVFIYRLSNTTWYSQTNTAALNVTSLNGVTGAVSTVALYDIGSFITGRPANGTAYAVNATLAGSSLYTTGSPAFWFGSGSAFSDTSFQTVASSLINTGSWRCVSPCTASNSNGIAAAGVWVRYA